jgi:RNA polymerase sigma-70 factor (ECF subfamily)
VLLEAAQYGDERAYDEIIRRTYHSVITFCRVMGSVNEAHDLAQETYTRIMKSRPHFQGIASVEAFVIHVAKCVCADYIRQRTALKEIQHTFIRTHDQTHDDAHSVEMEIVLSDLNRKMREPFVLTQLLGFSYEESASILSLPVGTIRSRVFRARENLAVLIEKLNAC